ncbi:MAG: hypothetical protein IJW51_08090 [Clostridia bacterium]|nr:hypothetical protein [Clostridia bacterium]
MYRDKRVLLIAGGGTLGTYVARELLSRGAFVDVICLEDCVSRDERLRYYKHLATVEFLREFLAGNRYDGIVNFIHYKRVEDYAPVHRLLIENTAHLIFLSSYRVYADAQHPITETAPRLLDVSKDIEFLKTEDYALPKARCEDFLRREHAGEPWTIVRPVISFSQRRFDVFVYSNNDIWTQIEAYGKLPLPTFAKELTAGIDWAGNSGKIIANLLFKKEALGEAYTVSSGQNLTWGEVASIYSRLMGFDVEWCDEARFVKSYPCLENKKKWLYLYDRKYDRLIDNSKVLAATGLGADDFLSVADGLKIELEKKAGTV